MLWHTVIRTHIQLVPIVVLSVLRVHALAPTAPVSTAAALLVPTAAIPVPTTTTTTVLPVAALCNILSIAVVMAVIAVPVAQLLLTIVAVARELVAAIALVPLGRPVL